MIPLADSNQPLGPAPVTVLLIAACAAVFAYEIRLSEIGLDTFIDAYALVPRRVDETLTALFDTGASLHGLWTLVKPFVTSMFLHGGVAHLVGNMLFLWVFGRSVEARVGSVAFAVLFLVCGCFAGGVHVLETADTRTPEWVIRLWHADDPWSQPTIGASGAIGGVLGAHFLLFPRSRIITFVPPLFLFPVPSVVFLGLWFVLEWMSASHGAHGSNIAHWAHVGGFGAGMICAVLAMTLAPRRVVGPEV